jgi:microcystin-dependent protein
MGEYYIGELRIFPYSRMPNGWMPCDGTILSLQSQAYHPLFSVISNTYGGDGQTVFLLPDLRGRVPLCFGRQIQTGITYNLAAKGGSESTTLGIENLPQHTHGVLVVSKAANAAGVAGSLLAIPANSDLEFAPANESTTVAMGALTIETTGGKAISNIQPYLGLVIAICVTGGILPLRQ